MAATSRTKNRTNLAGARRLPMVRALGMSGLDRRMAQSFQRARKGNVMAWFWLIVGGMCELVFTTALRFVDGFRTLPWTLAFLVSVAISMGLLELAAREIPMGTAYAVWGGVGAGGTVLVGMVW